MSDDTTTGGGQQAAPGGAPLPWSNREPELVPAAWEPDRDQLMGVLFDEYGRRFEVWRDRSGALRLNLGVVDLMLTLAEWADLERLANAVFDDAAAEIEFWKGRNPLPSHGVAVEVSADVWHSHLLNRARARFYQQLADADEATLRAEAGDAHFLTVNGERIATRVAREVDGATWRQDFYRAAKGQKIEVTENGE